MMPVGKLKTVKIITKNTFKTSEGMVKATKALDRLKYLGIRFSPEGLTSLYSDVDELLLRIFKASLKPLHRMHIVRTYILPKLYYDLVLSNSTTGRL